MTPERLQEIRDATKKIGCVDDPNPRSAECKCLGCALEALLMMLDRDEDLIKTLQAEIDRLEGLRGPWV